MSESWMAQWVYNMCRDENQWAKKSLAEIEEKKNMLRIKGELGCHGDGAKCG